MMKKFLLSQPKSFSLTFTKFNCFSQSYSPKTKEDIVSKVHKHNINTITMGFPDLYGRYLGKKFDTDYFVNKVLKNGSNCCNYLLSCDIAFNPVPNTQMASYERGFGDFTMKVDLDSTREINYINDHKQLLFFADLYDQQSGNAITHAPRHILRQAISDLKELGYSVQVQCDVNFTVFYEKYRRLSENFHHAQTLTDHSALYHTVYQLHTDEFLNKMKSSLKLSGINVEKITGFKAPGQFRMSLTPADCLEFCDNITLMKLCLKKLADEADKTVTFMAKICEEFTGNSLDFKLIIKDKNGNNILDSSYSDNSVKFKDPHGEKAISGVLAHLPDFTIFYAPTVNSYKRLKEPRFENSWYKLGYKEDGYAVNVIEEKNVSKLLFSLTGSDVNPYLSLFALLTSIKQGLTQNYNLHKTLEHLKGQSLPMNLNHASSSLLQNNLLKSALGSENLQHYWAFYNLEYTEFMNNVDEWEMNRYLFNI